MKLLAFEKIAAQFMETPIKTWQRQPSSLVLISESMSHRIKWRLSSPLLRSQGSSKLQAISIEIRTSMLFRTSESLESAQQLIQMESMMAIKANHDQTVWCDLCKVRFGVNHPKGQTPARWIVISETMQRKGVVRRYCQPCANECQTRHDGSTWTFREQLDYAIKGETLNGLES
jgi:hypothetical protein